MDGNMQVTPTLPHPLSGGGDDSLFAEFYRNPVDGLDHIRIRIPGDKTYLPDLLATEIHKQRFPRQWEAYRSQTDQTEGQTRLEEVGWIDDGTRGMLKALHIFTVEALAATTDGNLANIGMGARTLRERAQAFVDQRRKATAYEESETEKAAMREKLDAMQEKMDSLLPVSPKPAKAKTAG